MKTIKFFLLTLLSALVFGACSNEQKEPRDTSAPTKEVWLDLEMGPDAEEFRLLQNVVGGSITSPFVGSAKEFKILLCVNRNGATAPVYQKLTLTVPDSQLKPANQQDDSYATTIRPKYSGKVTVPSDGSGNYLLSAVVLEYDAGTGKTVYKSVALSGNEVSNIQVTSGGTAATQASPSDPILVQYPASGTDNRRVTQIDFKVPYIAEAVSVAPTATGTALEKVALKFKPSGRLLRFAVSNTLSCDANLKKLRIVSNAFFPDWKYDLSALTSGNLAQGKRADVNTWERTYTIDLAVPGKGKGKTYLGLWVMPNSATTGLNTKVYLTYDNNWETLAFESNNPLGTKGTQNISLSYPDPAYNGFPNNKLPYEYFAGLAKDEATVRGDAENIFSVTKPTVPYVHTDLAWMVMTDAYAAVATNTKYKIPTQEELGAILPATATTISTATASLKPGESIAVGGGEPKTYGSDYKASNNKVYAIRFTLDCNVSRMIYRYERIGTAGSFTTKDSYLKVSMKHIGVDDTYGTIEKLVAAGDAAFADAYSIYIPAPGAYGASGIAGQYVSMELLTSSNSSYRTSALRNLPTQYTNSPNSLKAVPLYHK